MADPKDTTSFFRKVVKFVANPTTEWTELAAPTEEARETEFAKSELKAMIERKRRNDFVRKREFDLLRKVRREGLTPEQLASLGSSARLDDSEARLSDSVARADSGVKAKIDEIEQQMVGDSHHGGLKRRPPEFFSAPTQPAAMGLSQPVPPAGTAPAPLARASGRGLFDALTSKSGALQPPEPPPTVAADLNLLDFGPGELGQAFAVEVSDVGHDPELDEAVIAFANADFEQCEQALSALTAQHGGRAQHAETWLVLFDLYRAIGQQQKFESLAQHYAEQFGWSAPQWFSLPRLVAEAAGDDRPRTARIDGQVGWVCPEHVDTDAVAALAGRALQMPLPWVFDWSALQHIDAQACSRMSELFRGWIGQKLDMRWLAGDRLLAVLQEASPTGVRDADPAYWLLRLDALRMINRPDQFDETAIDYCVTYEVSPPSWERAACQVRVSGSNPSTVVPTVSMVTEAASSFLESRLTEEAGLGHMATVELSGQLVGDIGDMLKSLDDQVKTASVVKVSCTRLIRVDFIAAGDLLNWVLARRGENRSVTFAEAHRLVALFFGAMGINEHARVTVRTN